MQKTIKSLLTLALMVPTIGYADSFTVNDMGNYGVLSDVISESSVANSGATFGPGVEIYGSAALFVDNEIPCLGLCDEEVASDASPSRTLSPAYYNNGVATLDPTGRSLIMGVQDMGYGVTLQRKVYIPTDSAFVRWINKIENTSDVDTTAYLVINGIIGGDSGVIYTSSGDDEPDYTDDWVLTASLAAPVPNSILAPDNFVAHIINGSGDGPDLEEIGFEEDAFWVYEVNLPAGATVIVMHFLADVTAIEAELGEGVLGYIEALAEADVPNALDFMTNEEFSQLLSAYDATLVLNTDSSSSSTCFIATAAFGTPMAEEIDTLRAVRDSYMLNNALGTTFVDTYYRLSPPIANKVAEYPAFAAVVRAVLMPIVLIGKVILAAPMMVLTSLLVMMGLLVARRTKGAVS